MDVKRKQRKGLKWFKRITIFVILIGGGTGITVGLNRLQPAAKPVDRQSVVVGTVKRELFLREVRGNGSLVPIDITIVPSPVAGRVVRVSILPGTMVTEDTIIVELDNPELENSAFERGSERMIPHTGTETRTRLLREAAVGNIGQWAKA